MQQGALIRAFGAVRLTGQAGSSDQFGLCLSQNQSAGPCLNGCHASRLKARQQLLSDQRLQGRYAECSAHGRRQLRVCQCDLAQVHPVQEQDQSLHDLDRVGVLLQGKDGSADPRAAALSGSTVGAERAHTRPPCS